MASYNREFLIPYLRDICALHLAKAKFETEKDEVYFRRTKIQHLQEPHHPSIPCEKPVITFGRAISLVVGTSIIIFDLVFLIVGIVDGMTPFFPWLIAAAFIFAIGFAFF